MKKRLKRIFKKVDYPAQFFVQELFVAIVWLMWIVSVVIQVVMAADLFSRNPNLSSFYSQFLYATTIPVVLFVIAWFIHPPARKWTRFFHGTLIAVSGTLFASMVGMLTNLFITRNMVWQDPLTWWYVELVTALCSIIAFVAVLAVARYRGRWI